MKFKIMNSGDYSVGINGFSFDIEFQFEKNDEYETFFDEDFKERFKKFMIDELSYHDGITEIMTEKEFEQLQYSYIVEEDFNKGNY